jgi:hypothetical protein
MRIQGIAKMRPGEKRIIKEFNYKDCCSFAFSSILFMISRLMIFWSLFIISMRLSKERMMHSASLSVITVAVLCSSLRRAISQNISPSLSDLNFSPLRLRETIHDCII